MLATKKIKSEWQVFLAAMMFYTRLRVEKIYTYHPSHLNAATRYLPLVGLVVGLSGSAVLIGVSYVLNHQLAASLAIFVQIIFTGAFHEDGLADMVDGFGGSAKRERILEIMKDSRVGNFGVLSLILVVLVKYSTLVSISVHSGAYLLVLTGIVSRFAPIAVMRSLPYVQLDTVSKVKPIAMPPSNFIFLFALIVTLLSILTLDYFKNGLSLLIPSFLGLILTVKYFNRLLFRKLGGYTGDCLGAVQQLTELVVMILAIAICKF